MNFIYITTNLLNGKQYIGSHYGDINDNYLGSGKILKYSIKKYGKENFRREILEECNPEDNLILETKYIRKYNTLQPNGYNILENGGYIKYSKELKEKLSNSHKGKKLSDEHKENISLALKGRKNKPLSKKHKYNISEAKKGTVSWNKGKNLSKEHRERLSASHTGKILSKETKKKMSEFQKGRVKSEKERKSISESKMGEKNPLYGKDPWNKGKLGYQCWISNDSLMKNKFILTFTLEKYIKEGWVKGRKKYNIEN